MAASKDQRERWQEDLDALLDRELRSTSNAMHRTYADMLRTLKASLADYLDRYGELSFSKRLEVERLFKTAKELSAELDGSFLLVGQFVREYATTSGLAGYSGVWYALEQVEGLQVAGMGLDRRFLEAAVSAPVAGKRLSSRLYRDRNKLARDVHGAIVRGIVEGRGYREIARTITDHTEASFRNAHRIAQTEGGRVRSMATQQSYNDAVSAGVDMSKRWMSTLDKRTRHDHRFLDGQIVAYDGEFAALMGERAQGPRLFGVAALDIRCRCTTEPIIDGWGAEVRRNNEDGETIEYQTFDNWFKGS